MTISRVAAAEPKSSILRRNKQASGDLRNWHEADTLRWFALSPLLGVTRKSHFGAVSSAFDPAETFVSSPASRKVSTLGYCTRQLRMGDSMRRRDFITILGGAAATQVTSPALLRAATSAKRPIIGSSGVLYIRRRQASGSSSAIF